MARERSDAATDIAFDALLVTLMQSGDRTAAARLAQRWHPRLLRTARRLVGSELASGAVQDSWIAILRGIDRLREADRFAPWAFSILHRRCADTIQAEQRERSHRGEMPDEAAAAPAPGEGVVAIAQAMAMLPPDQSFAAQLFYVEGLTLAEIAEVQQVPVGTAKSRLFHARRQLKLALGDEPTGD